MDGVNVTILKSSTKVVEISSKSNLLEAIKTVQEKTNQFLTEIIESSKGNGNNNMETGPAENGTISITYIPMYKLYVLLF